MELAKQDIKMRTMNNQANLQLKAQKQQQDNVFKMQKLNIDEQKLAAQLIKDQKIESLEKEKLASKILQQGIN